MKFGKTEKVCTIALFFLLVLGVVGIYLEADLSPPGLLNPPPAVTD